MSSQGQNIVGLAMGISFSVVGYLLITKERFAEWGFSHGRARLWVVLFGIERAKKLAKYFFGPVILLLGIGAILGSIVTFVHPR